MFLIFKFQVLSVRLLLQHHAHLPGCLLPLSKFHFLLIILNAVL